MDFMELTEKIGSLKSEGEKFLLQNEENIIEFLRKERVTAEENLKKEIVFELLDNVYGMCHTAEYIGKKISREGFLKRNEMGEITLDNEVLPLMTEIEIYIYDEDMEQEVWTRTYVGGTEKRYLVGIDRSQDLDGLKARIRD